MARPTKLTDKFIDVAKKVIDSEDVVYLTDEELLDEINDNLPEKERISQRTFIRWKKLNKGEDDTEEDEKEMDEQTKMKGWAFCHLIKRALRREKKALIKELKDADLKSDPWHKYAWILERKFTEWNLHQKTEMALKHDGKIDSDQTITFQVVDFAGTSDAPKGNAKKGGKKGKS